MSSNKNVIFKNYEFITVKGVACQLGFGSYGSVQLAKCLKSGKLVALKKISRKVSDNEVEIHKNLNHPNIIKLLDFFFDQKTLCSYLVLEYAENGNLFDFIQTNSVRDHRTINGIFNSVCDALAYLHSNNIMHRDIKPQNILFDKNFTVKICDFGFAVACQPRVTLCGTLEYMAPQMLLRNSYNHKIDIWALGILLYELIQGRSPFLGISPQQILEQMKSPIIFSKKFLPTQIALIKSLLKIKSEDRPQIQKVIKTSNLFLNQKKIKEISRRQTTDSQHLEEPKIKILDIKSYIKPLQIKSTQIQITSIKILSPIPSLPNLLLSSKDENSRNSLFMKSNEKISLKRNSKKV